MFLYKWTVLHAYITTLYDTRIVRLRARAPVVTVKNADGVGDDGDPRTWFLTSEIGLFTRHPTNFSFTIIITIIAVRPR